MGRALGKVGYTVCFLPWFLLSDGPQLGGSRLVWGGGTTLPSSAEGSSCLGGHSPRAISHLGPPSGGAHSFCVPAEG